MGSPVGSYFVIGAFLLLVLLRQHHPQGEEGHDQPVAKVPEHHREQEGEGDDGVGSWKHTGRERTSPDGLHSVFMEGAVGEI